MTFRITALPAAAFAPLFTLSDAALAERRARRVIADADPGYPCRVSLMDAMVGESLILVHHLHHPVETPFRASHAVFVRERAVEARPAPGEIPAALRRRALSLRGFTSDGEMVAAELVADGDPAPAVLAMLDDPAIGYLHLHTARQGCYLAMARRLSD